MSDQWNQYPPQNYQSPPPQGYPPHQPSYDQSQYPQQGYPPPAPQYGDAPAGYGAPARTNSFGPPQHGGFQHGQQGGQYGAYDASNPQGQPAYYGQDDRGYGPPQQPTHDQQQSYTHDPNYPQHQGSYDQEQPGIPPTYHDPNAPQDPNAPYDPNAPEGERGLMGALAGGFAGRKAGNHFGGHGIIGMIGGAIAGSKLEDKYKESHGHHGGSHHGSNQGGSSWGGASGFGKW